MEKRYSCSRLVSAGAVLAIWLPTFGMCDDYEVPAVLSASDTVLDLPLKTDTYEIHQDVPTDGFMAVFTITSPYGEFTASGPGMLASRLNEIKALAALDIMQEDDRFAEAAESTAKETVSNLRQFIENPKETVQGVPDGVGRFFDRTGRTLKTGLQKIGDVREGRLPGAEENTAENLPGGTPAQNNPGVSLTESVARAGGDTAINILGFDKQRRRLAKELAVDPYSTNRILSEKLDEVTWAAFAGGLGVNVLTSLVPGGFVLSTSSRLSDWVWDTAPGDLRVEIENALLSMGVGQSETDQLLRHSFYTLSMQAALTASMQALDGVEGRADVIPLVLSVASEGQARFLVQTIDMLALYHTEREPLSELQVQGTILGMSQAGQPVIAAPVDYLSWTPLLDRFASSFGDQSAVAPLVFVDGQLSKRARDELTELGWNIEERTPLASRAYPVQ